MSSSSVKVFVSWLMRLATALVVFGQLGLSNMIIPPTDCVLHRNFNPVPPPCRISFDKDGHAIALTDLERSGKPAPTPTPMYAGVTANTPRVRIKFLSTKLILINGFLRISCPIAQTHTLKARQNTQPIKSFISINNSTLPHSLTTFDSIE